MPATFTDYCAAIDRLNVSIDRVLAAGHAAQERYDQFCERHGIVAGAGARALTADMLPPAQRHHHRGLLQLMEKLYGEHATTRVPRPSNASARLAASAPRALANRTRI